MTMRNIFFILFFLLAGTINAYGQVVVIANKSVPADTIEKSELVNFYTGDIREWSDKQPVVVLDLKNTGEVKRIFYELLGKRASKMKSIWLKKKLLGEGDPPLFMGSEQEVLQKVASTPGAIGYVNQSEASDEVKILLVIIMNKG